MTWRGTPGPWKADRNHGCKSIKGPPIGPRQPRSEIGYTSGLWDDDQDKANAKGMAAVPQLVEALLSARRKLMEEKDVRNAGGEYSVAGHLGLTVAEIDAALKAAGVTP